MRQIIESGKPTAVINRVIARQKLFCLRNAAIYNVLMGRDAHTVFEKSTQIVLAHISGGRKFFKAYLVFEIAVDIL